jgi:predicted dehydrogenase
MPGPYRAAIIGAGRIASEYDEPGQSLTLTHAHAISTSGRVQLAGFFDLDSRKAETAARKWGVQSFPSLDAMMSEKIDIAVVTVPNEQHGAVLDTLLDYKPRLVLCEKPLTTDHRRSLEIAAVYHSRKITLAVNYQRRYDPTVCELKARMQNGHTGAFITGSLIYSKGILHNGSHGVDVLRYLFGEPSGFIVTSKVYDHSSHDPATAGILNFQNAQIHLIAGDERHFSIFEIDLIFERARYRFLQSGLSMERYEVRSDAVFSGYREMTLIASAPTGLGTALTLMVQDLAAHLDSGSELRIGASSILNTQFVCEKLAAAPFYQYVSLDTNS